MAEDELLRVYCDFNDGTEDDRFWILWYQDQPLEDQAEKLGLKEGQRVLLFQDDFSVEGILLFNQTHEWFLGKKLVARADWSTSRYVE